MWFELNSFAKLTLRYSFMFSLLLCLLVPDFDSQVTHGYANSGGVKIHYAALGDPTKPLIVMIHGFPDFWYTWREQMKALSSDFYCVAIDQRGYNLSDKPTGGENYDMKFLVGDVAAVIKHLGQEIVGAAAGEVPPAQPTSGARWVGWRNGRTNRPR